MNGVTLPPVRGCTTAHRTPPAPVVDDAGRALDRVRALWHAATPDERHEGLTWFNTNGHTLARAAVAAGLPAVAGAVVAAVLSPRSPWPDNLAAALRVLEHPTRAPGGVVLPLQVAAARGWLTGTVDLVTALNGHKVRAFAHNLAAAVGAGTLDVATVDVWSMRAVTGRSVDPGKCGCGHVAAGAVFNALADEVGTTPAQAQAVAWCVVRNRWHERRHEVQGVPGWPGGAA